MWVVWALSRAALLGAVWLFDGDDDVTELAWTWADALLHGQSPYTDVGMAYPPLAMLGFALPGLVADVPSHYALPFAAAMLAVDFAGARLGGWRYVLAVPAIGPVLLLWRYDLAPAVCHLAALCCAARGARASSWVWLGVGIALKPYLLVVVPLWWMWDRAWRVVLAVVPSLLAGLVMSSLIGFAWVDAYVFQGAREVSVEAGPAVVAAVLGVGSVAVDEACLCWVREGVPGWPGSLLGLALLGWVYWRGPASLAASSVAAVAALLLAAPVFSPQYLVWLLPPAALLGTRALLLAAGAALTGFLAYPPLYDDVLAATPLGLALLLTRAALLAALLRPQNWQPELAPTK